MVGCTVRNLCGVFLVDSTFTAFNFSKDFHALTSTTLPPTNTLGKKSRKQTGDLKAKNKYEIITILCEEINK